MRRLIRSLGYSVDDFTSATDFLASPRLADTACLISDINMPVMSGLELFRHLVAQGCTIPTIFVTGLPNDSDEAHALNDGVLCYLAKPVDEERLTRCLFEALRSAGSLK
ncbi:response regulator [Rhizobium calliandrae]|uniref:Response regulator n=1 Tax=Rhizobium calliandrae TaxID=1312182 RepID=A0ABT7KE05_9HYPH|nr:response regulator [Rhizobium calliandrae]MDL2406854.1 response regulator [Rhizobium calliandrae]